MAELIPDLDSVIAHLPGVIKEVHNTAKRGAARAEAILAAHHHEGHAKITVTRGTVDSFINLDDTRGDHAAAAIEYGRSGGRSGASQGIFALGGAFN